METTTKRKPSDRGDETVIPRIWWGAAAVTGVLLALVVGVALWLGADARHQLGMDIAEACVQLLVVVGLGGVVGFVIKLLEQQREDRRRRNDIRFRTFQDIVTAYYRLKFVRRSLRAVGLRGQAELLREEQLTALRICMTTVIEVHLTFEQTDRELAACPVFADTGTIRGHLSRLTTYVGALVREWERNGGKIWKNEQSIRVCDLPKLQAFLGPASDDFTVGAADPVGWVEWLVRDQIVATPHHRGRTTDQADVDGFFAPALIDSESAPDRQS